MYILAMGHTIVAVRGQQFSSKDHVIIIKKGTVAARMVAINEVPEMVVANGAVEAL